MPSLPSGASACPSHHCRSPLTLTQGNALWRRRETHDGGTPPPTVNQTLHYPGAAGGRQTQPIRGLDTALCPHGENPPGAGGAPLPKASRPCSSGPDSTRLWLSRAQVTPRSGEQRNDTRLAVRARPGERERGLPAPRPSLRAGGQRDQPCSSPSHRLLDLLRLDATEGGHAQLPASKTADES